MLAKQNWRIQNRLDSLLARTYKAKYFPRTTLKGNNPKPHHSWTWRSITISKCADLRQGRLLVGSGQQIPLAHPDWFQTSNQKLREVNFLNGTVADIIDSNSRSWKCDLIRRIYPYPTCAEILNTPFTKTEGNPDKLVWRHSSSGDYRVNQVCSLFQKVQHGAVNEGLNNRGTSEGVWKLIWNLKLPIRILTFIWKILHDSVACFATLNRRGIQTSTRCLLCDAEEEFSTHLFLNCTFARAVWHGLNLVIRTTDMNYASLRQWLLGYISTKSVTGVHHIANQSQVFTILCTQRLSTRFRLTRKVSNPSLGHLFSTKTGKFLSRWQLNKIGLEGVVIHLKQGTWKVYCYSEEDRAESS